MNIILNDKAIELPSGCSLKTALKTNGYTDSHCAVAVNKTFIPKSRHDEIYLQEGDTIEVLAPMQGG